ncbi:molybdopterin molybdotransferase [Antricoccus suffuscus]|uniref:Molybdopterin molybdenumtransferase n=1 Tax=Antricoccus suffuscus TaxID=1629062 RepID=A0A2T0ZY12_9ACTN|nr:gephyrin-like molybdotransferase Glp [Antricoccus suffuscus]PRZ41223.1 molybdopterin molybdotransferase [Antricoccus suffuscus]
MRTVEEHVDTILSSLPTLESIELAVLDAQGLLCGEEVVSSTMLPAFDHSSIDGYAVRRADLKNASPDEPAHLPVVAEAEPGSREQRNVSPGSAIRIFPGALLPGGADAIVPLAWTDRGVARVNVVRCPPAGAYIRRAGEDVQPGDTAVNVGTPIGPAQVGLLAAVGRVRVQARPRPRVTVLSIGSELVDVGTTPEPGELVDVNSFALSAAARDAGGAVYRAGSVPANRDRLMSTLEAQLLRTDLLILSGGFASGSFDVVSECLSELGQVEYSRVAMQPGMPQGFGVIGEREVPVICLPNDPVSALVSFEVFARPAIRHMLGKKRLFRPMTKAAATEHLNSPAGRKQFRRGLLMRHPDGGYVVSPVGGAGAHLLFSMAQANCLIVIPEDVTEVTEGANVSVMPLVLGS